MSIEHFKCNRCPWNDLTADHFDINKRTGEYLKSCRKCMIYSKAWSKQKYENEKEYMSEMIYCGCKTHIKRFSITSHNKSKKHLAYLETLDK